MYKHVEEELARQNLEVEKSQADNMPNSIIMQRDLQGLQKQIEQEMAKKGHPDPVVELARDDLIRCFKLNDRRLVAELEIY